jgi:tetratricopeptide (TPR) repeat protein
MLNLKNTRLLSTSLCFAGLLLLSCKWKDHKKEDPATHLDREEVKNNDKGVVLLSTGTESEYSGDYRKASEYLADKKFTEAIKIYQHLLEVEKDKNVPYEGLGSVYLSMNDLASAKNYYGKALAFNSSDFIATLDMGSVYFTEENYPESLNWYMKAKKLDTANADVYWGLALAYQYMGKLKEAKENARKFITMVPDSKYRPDVETILNATE